MVDIKLADVDLSGIVQAVSSGYVFEACEGSPEEYLSEIRHYKSSRARDSGTVSMNASRDIVNSMGRCSDNFLREVKGCCFAEDTDVEQNHDLQRIQTFLGEGGRLIILPEECYGFMAFQEVNYWSRNDPHLKRVPSVGAPKIKAGHYHKFSIEARSPNRELVIASVIKENPAEGIYLLNTIINWDQLDLVRAERLR